VSGRPTTLGFRAEQARIGEAAPGEVLLELQGCETLAVEQLGDRAYCYLRSSLGELVLMAPDGAADLSGTLRLAMAPASLHFFDAEGMAVGSEERRLAA
ncbi:MAG TPA: sugar ABC transporter ATP-binding protein, partial [Variovorax sp.]|nr:sugar ABC transporter ATP-binding protein [Variovorax sp.]